MFSVEAFQRPNILLWWLFLRLVCHWSSYIPQR